MITATATPCSAGERVSRMRRSDDIFFSSMAVLILATVLVGFARTYFLAGVFRAPLPNLLVHVHGAVFSCWILLFIIQVSLVSAGRVDIHRKLGLAGFGLACLMVPLGLAAATDSLSRNFSPPGFPFGAKAFYAIPVLAMVQFATLIFFAYGFRSNPAAHKRLILISTISLMGAPTGRPPFATITGHPHMGDIFIWLFLLLVIGYDLWSTHRVYRATIWASLFVFVMGQILVPIGMTGAWQSFATWMQSLSGMPH